MATFKEVSFKLSTPLAYFLPLPMLRRMSGINYLVPLYHAINNEIPAHLRYLYSIKTPEQFEKDMDLFCHYYQPVSLQEFIRLSHDGTLKKHPVFHLTFDDGLKEFYHVAAPILVRKGIPASCFVNTGFIDNNNMLFRFKISILIDHLHHESPGSKSWVKFHEWLQEYGLGKMYYKKILLGFTMTDTPKIEKLAKYLQIDFKQYLADHKPYMTSHQIAELISKGFTFGAHSVDHPEYRLINKEEQTDQTLKSIQQISGSFKIPYKVFSFPFTDQGISKQFFKNISDKIDLTFGCAGVKSDSVTTNIQRFPVETYSGGLMNNLKKEYLYSSLLRIIGKHTIKRF